MITIAIANQKGGVGKTTIAFNLSWILADIFKKNVLAIDNDPQGNLTSSFLENPIINLNGNILNAYEGPELKPERISKHLRFLGTDISLTPVSERDFQVIYQLKESLKKLYKSSKSDPFDFIVIDTLPSFGHLHLAALNAADYVLIPVKPAPYALSGMKDLIDTIEKARKYFNPKLKVIGIVINQVDGRKLIMEREMEELLRETYGRLVLKTKIYKRVRVEESPAFQKYVSKYSPNDPSAKEFKEMVKEILRRINKNKKVKS